MDAFNVSVNEDDDDNDNKNDYVCNFVTEKNQLETQMK